MTKYSFAHVRVSDCCRSGCCYWQRCLRSMSCTSDLLAQQRANLGAACHACVPEPFLSGFLHDFLYLRSVRIFLALHAWHTIMLAKSGVGLIVSIMKYALWWVLMRISLCLLLLTRTSMCTTVSCHVTYAEGFRQCRDGWRL